MKRHYNLFSSEANPGFSVGGGANPPGVRQHTILPNVPKNFMKLRKFWAVGWGDPTRGNPISVTGNVKLSHTTLHGTVNNNRLN